MGRAIQRVVDILEFVAAAQDGRTHSDLAKGLGIPKSSLTDLLKDLVDRHYLEVRRDGVYLIGPGSLSISRSYLKRLDAVSLASDILVFLRDETDEGVVLMVRHDLEVVVVSKENSNHAVGAPMIIGDRGPLVSTAGGKALLAFMGDEAIDNVIKDSERRGITLRPIHKANLKRELKLVREGGLAFSREEWLESVIGIGLPVMGLDGPICSISFGAPMTRMTEARIRQIEPVLRKGVDRLSARLAGITMADLRAVRR